LSTRGLPNGAYTMARLDPGRYEFAQRLGNLWVHLPSHTFQMQVNSGEVYFIGSIQTLVRGTCWYLGPLVSMSIKMRIEFGPVERSRRSMVLKDCHYDERTPDSTQSRSVTTSMTNRFGPARR